MELFAALTPGTTVLTPNRRLSAALLKLHGNHQKAAGKFCWPTLTILPIASWLQRAWTDYSSQQIEETLPIQITPDQEQLAWEEILRPYAENENLLQLSSTAELAKSAWATLKQWQVDIANPGLRTTEDAAIFQGWAQKFQELCQKNNFLDTNSIASVLIGKILLGEIKTPPHIILIGFTEISPLYQALIDACKQAGSIVETHIPQLVDNSIQRVALTDEETEILSMARWSKAILEKNPEAKIGCVFQRLEDIRDRVVRIFSAVYSEKNTFTLNPTKLPFNISAGKNLSQYPVIHTALQLLTLSRTKIPIDNFSKILRSPFIIDAESEALQRAEFDTGLREKNITVFSLKKLIFSFGLQDKCPALMHSLKAVQENKIDKKQKLAVSQWIEIFMEQLKLFGWPGQRSLNSQEYQVVDSWLKLLLDYSSFNNILGVLDYKQALHYLTYLTTQKIFQPESPDANIQILGMLEATELPFDHLWVMGMDDSAWPPAPKPNPFIPQKLQKAMQMPHATAERELIYCKLLTAQLKRGAPEVIFSYAKQNDEAELRPSPIITDILEINAAQIHLADYTAPALGIFHSKNLEEIFDETAPAINAEEKIRGGSGIFKEQAACPFRSFAMHRLHAKKIEAPTPGLNARERGSVVHDAMEYMWTQLKDSQNLFEKDAASLQAIITEAVENAISKVRIISDNNTRYLDLEAIRLQKILSQWFEHERKRPEFTVIALEEERNATIGNIPVRLRIDRIDQVNQKNLIIDYKTGKENSSKKWFSDRPDEPQLPLYCVIEPDKTLGIAFAQLNPEKMGFIGASAEDTGISTIKSLEKIKDTNARDWQDQIQQWKITLENLANDFSEGKANVDPKFLLETCKHCHLETFCRIKEG
jgi:ATP-dependent helicase/nuclease subunit B